MRSFDVIVDATDNAPSRYLINDACVLAGKPLVSGAAIGTDGQLTVYNHGSDGGPLPSMLDGLYERHAMEYNIHC